MDICNTFTFKCLHCLFSRMPFVIEVMIITISLKYLCNRWFRYLHSYWIPIMNRLLLKRNQTLILPLHINNKDLKCIRCILEVWPRISRHWIHKHCHLFYHQILGKHSWVRLLVQNPMWITYWVVQLIHRYYWRA